MDPDLKAFTSIGQLSKIKENFREAQTRLTDLERANQSLREKVCALEQRLDDLAAAVPGLGSPVEDPDLPNKSE